MIRDLNFQAVAYEHEPHQYEGQIVVKTPNQDQKVICRTRTPETPIGLFATERDAIQAVMVKFGSKLEKLFE